MAADVDIEERRLTFISATYNEADVADVVDVFARDDFIVKYVDETYRF